MAVFNLVKISLRKIGILQISTAKKLTVLIDDLFIQAKTGISLIEVKIPAMPENSRFPGKQLITRNPDSVPKKDSAAFHCPIWATANAFPGTFVPRGLRHPQRQQK